MYNIDRKVEGNERYRCKNRKCSGFLVISLENKILQSIPHTCIPNVANCELKMLMNTIKEKVESSNEKFIQLFTDTTSNHTNDVLAELPDYNSLRDYATKKNEVKTKITYHLNSTKFPNFFKIRLMEKFFINTILVLTMKIVLSYFLMLSF
jgi:hypothetical protein